MVKMQGDNKIIQASGKKKIVILGGTWADSKWREDRLGHGEDNVDAVDGEDFIEEVVCSEIGNRLCGHAFF